MQPPACHCSVLTPSTRRLRVSVCARCIMKRSRDESSGAQGGLLVRPSSVVSPGQLLCTPAAGAAAVRVGSGVQALGGALAAERGGALRRTKDGRLWVDSAVRRYVPCAGDPVVGVVAERHGETLLVSASAACAPARAPPARPLTPPPSLCPLHTRSTQRRGLGVQHMRACAGCAKGCQERGARGGHARSLARSLAGRQAGRRAPGSLADTTCLPRPAPRAFYGPHKVDVGSSHRCALPALAFENATRRNRPTLRVGDLVLARVARCAGGAEHEPELSCVDAQGLASGYGPLKGGVAFRCSGALARAVLRKKVRRGRAR